MPTLPHRLALPAPLLALTAAIVALLLVGAAPAMAVQSDDFWDAVSLSTDASGAEVPYDGDQVLVRSTSVFDTSAFTVEADGEGTTGTRNRTGCALQESDPRFPGYSYGAKTSWTRFLSAVPGTAQFSVSTDYDVVVRVYEAPDAVAGNWRPHLLTDVNCSNEVAGPGESITQVRVAPGKPVYLQTMGLCGFGTTPAAGCPDPSVAQGGGTFVQMRFVPDPQPQPQPEPQPQVPPEPQPTADLAAPVTADAGAGFAVGGGVLDPGTAGIAESPFPGPSDTGLGGSASAAAPSLPRLQAAAVFAPGRSRTKVRQLTLAAIGAGSTVAVRCTGGGCPKARSLRVKRTGTVRLARFFRRALRVDATIEIHVTRPGYVGRALRFTMRPGARPARSGACVSEAGRTIDCPASGA